MAAPCASSPAFFKDRFRFRRKFAPRSHFTSSPRAAMIRAGYRGVGAAVRAWNRNRNRNQAGVGWGGTEGRGGPGVG